MIAKSGICLIGKTLEKTVLFGSICAEVSIFTDFSSIFTEFSSIFAEFSLIFKSNDSLANSNNRKIVFWFKIKCNLCENDKSTKINKLKIEKIKKISTCMI